MNYKSFLFEKLDEGIAMVAFAKFTLQNTLRELRIADPAPPYTSGRSSGNPGR